MFRDIVEAETVSALDEREEDEERNRLADLTMTCPAEAQGTRKWSVWGVLSLAALLRHLNPARRAALREHLMRHVGDEGHTGIVLGQEQPSR